MILTLKHKLDNKYYPLIDTMSEISNYLYNQINYKIRTNYFNHKYTEDELISKNIENIKFSKSYINFKNPELYYDVKKLNNYNILPNSIRQNVGLKLNQDYCSFFRLLKKKLKGEYDEKLTLPRYKKSKFPHTMMLATGNFRVKIIDNNVKITITTPKKFVYENRNLEKKEFINDLGKIEVNLNLNSFKELNKINVIEMKKYNGSWYLNISYKTNDVHNFSLLEDKDKIRGIDLGVNNLRSLIDYKGNGIIYDGKQIKSRNQYYNKIKSKLQKQIDDLGNTKKGKTSFTYKSLNKKLDNITLNRNNYVNDYLHKTSENILKHCENNDVRILVIGKNKEWKNEINIGKVNNQKFTSIPHTRLIDMLKYKGELRKINIVEVEESYTSKTDNLVNEPLPKYTETKSNKKTNKKDKINNIEKEENNVEIKELNNNEKVKKQSKGINPLTNEKYLGKRKCRGLFQSSLGILINRDINGSIGIVRKFYQLYSKNVVRNSLQFIEKILNSRIFLNPVKQFVYNN